MAISASDGTSRATHRIDAVPIFDGLVAAHNSLYMVTRDGKIICFRAD
ncbi:MAG: hypothetical protein ACYS9X_17925 [Planctomycetota bacterium]|jgi:hypothetical protein